MRDIYVGVDTSCYMTSAAVMCGEKIYQYKKPLSVKNGLCGLRQSEALFQHIKNLPLIFEEISNDFCPKEHKWAAVAVSTRPRSVEGSYMPVFLAGENAAKAAAAACGAKLVKTSHQDGHITAALYSAKMLSALTEPFLSVHLSGGTTEILLTEFSGGVYKCQIVGGTLDLPAGQLIDRIGVLLGRPFPAGKYMDYSALNFEGEKDIKNKISVSNGFINFSGQETKIKRMVEAGEADGEKAAYATMCCVADSVKTAVLQTKKKTGVKKVIMAGGVSSSGFLRKAFFDVPGVYFAEKDFSGDNAAGVCLLGRFNTEEEGWFL